MESYRNTFSNAYTELQSESVKKVSKIAIAIKDILTKENLSYKEAIVALELAQEEIKDCTII